MYSNRVGLSQDGEEYVGLCPLHGEKTPSFRVSVHENVYVWKCFGCGASGDVFKFVQQVDDCSFTEAVRKTIEEIGGNWNKKKESVDRTFKPIVAPEPYKTLSLSDYSKLEEYLYKSKEAREWLTSRGIEYETARRLHLGFRQDVGKLAGEANKEIANKGWIVFPCIEGNTVVTIEYRSIVEKAFCRQGGMAKGDKTPLFNSNTIESLEPVYVTEGKADAVIMEQAGFKAVSVQSAGTPITAANKDMLLKAECIILAGDNDLVGNEYMDKVWAEMPERTYKLSWPSEHKDANKTFLDQCGRNIQEFQALVDQLTIKAKSTPMPGISDLKESFLTSQRVSLEDHPQRFRFPWPSMDSMANILPGDVVYISSTNTGMGKTSLMMNASIYNALRGDVVLNYSTELDTKEYSQIVVAHILKKNRNQLTQQDYKDAYKYLSNITYYIGHDPDLNTANEVLDLLESAIQRLGATTVILDHIHFVTLNEKDTVKAQENAMQRIKNMARKYRVKWINLGQPRKADQKNKTKPVHITDAKGSEMIISASSVSYALHRDVAKVTDPNHPPKEPYEPLVKVFLQKGRSQGLGNAYTELFFHGDTCSFSEVTNLIQPPTGLFNNNDI